MKGAAWADEPAPSRAARLQILAALELGKLQLRALAVVRLVSHQVASLAVNGSDPKRRGLVTTPMGWNRGMRR